MFKFSHRQCPVIEVIAIFLAVIAAVMLGVAVFFIYKAEMNMRVATHPGIEMFREYAERKRAWQSSVDLVIHGK